MGKNSKQPPTKYALQSITDDDCVAGALELGQKLSRHLAALDNNGHRNSNEAIGLARCTRVVRDRRIVPSTGSGADAAPATADTDCKKPGDLCTALLGISCDVGKYPA